MRRLPPALAATATPGILELLGEPPGRVPEPVRRESSSWTSTASLQ